MQEILASLSVEAVVFLYVSMAVLTFAILELLPQWTDLAVALVELRLKGKRATGRMAKRLLAVCFDNLEAEPHSAEEIERRLALLEPEVFNRYWLANAPLLNACCHLPPLIGMGLSLVGTFATANPSMMSRGQSFGPLMIGVLASAVAGCADLLLIKTINLRRLPAMVYRGNLTKANAVPQKKRWLVLHGHSSPLLLAFYICSADFWMASYLRDCQPSGTPSIRSEAEVESGDPTASEPLLEVVLFPDDSARIGGVLLPPEDEDGARVTVLTEIIRGRFLNGTAGIRGPPADAIMVSMRLHAASTSASAMRLKIMVQAAVNVVSTERFGKRITAQFFDQVF